MYGEFNFVYSIWFKWASAIYNFYTVCLQVKKLGTWTSQGGGLGKSDDFSTN